MTTRVDFAPPFTKALRRLKQKFPLVRVEVDDLVTELENDERPGDKIPGVGYDVYKVRLANPSAGRGKSGSFRVIYYVWRADGVLLLTLYAKTEHEDIAPEQIRRIIEEYEQSS